MIKLCRIVGVAVLVALAGAAAAQQPYPNRPIRLLVPYPPGGGTDSLARLVAQKLTDAWSQQVVVDNRPGGNTVIATEALAKSPADGYTIMLMAMDHTIVPNLQPTPYDPIADFSPVATVTSSEFVLVATPSLPANNLQELIALAKSRPATLNYASAGTGGSIHLASETFNLRAGISTRHIPYKGFGAILGDLIAGRVQLFFGVPIAVTPHVKAGKLKAIAISGETRSALLPQVPTFTEAGLPGLDIRLWYGVIAPAATPKDIVDKLSTEIRRVLTIPEVNDKLVNQGMQPFISSPEQFATLIRTDVARFAKLIKTVNIKLEN